MKRLLMLAAPAAIVMACTLPASGQPRPGAAELPISEVVLFSSGVGYFQREGSLEGPARIDLRFPMADINDLLKSLVLEDKSGQVGAVTYDNRNPLEMTLKSFALDLTANPSMGDLINQARGEKAEVVTTADVRTPTITQGESLQGIIVGVEKKRQVVGKDVIESAQLNLLTPDGLRGLPMSLVQKVRFLKPDLDQEFRKALEALATGHDKQKKTVSINFAGTGKRAVKVGYVTESPIWKTSYRLSLDKEKNYLQGWAIIENTTDEDWTNVRLGLVSGRPISFKMDLYEPLFVARPMVEPELFASLRPRVYDANMLGDKEKTALGARRAGSLADRRLTEAEANRPLAPEARPTSPMAGFGAQAAEAKDALGLLGRNAKREELQFRRGVASVAAATELGEYFQYVIRQAVNLPRQKSALLPIVGQDVSSTKVSIYNESVHGKFPLLGLRFKNNTPLHLCQGPVTVFENGSYAGDARLPDMRPNESRLVSYAVDLGTEVEPKAKFQETLQGIKVVKGILYATFQTRETKEYVVKNRSDTARTVLIEHPYRSQYKLITPDKATEKARDVYRFELKAEPNEPVKLQVVEELPRVQTVALTNSSDEQVRVFLKASVITPQVKKALEEALSLKAKLNENQSDLKKQQDELKMITEDQGRMRANMERVPKDSTPYKRYLTKFNDQETTIEGLQERIGKLRDKAETLRKEYETFLAGLNVG